MRVKFKQLRDNAKLPTKAHDSDFCYDVYACDCEEIAPNVYKYNLGFSVQIDRSNKDFKIPYGYGEKLSLSIDIRPRSSIYKTGMVLCNSCATIDWDYTGEVCLLFYHVNTSLPKYEVGDRIGQMKIGMTPLMQFEIVDELEETDRGDGGLGSTGNN